MSDENKDQQPPTPPTPPNKKAQAESGKAAIDIANLKAEILSLTEANETLKQRAAALNKENESLRKFAAHSTGDDAFEKEVTERVNLSRGALSRELAREVVRRQRESDAAAKELEEAAKAAAK